MSAIKLLETTPAQIIDHVRETEDHVDLQKSFLLQEHGAGGEEDDIDQLPKCSSCKTDSSLLSPYLDGLADKLENWPPDRGVITKTLSDRVGRKDSRLEGAVRRVFSMRRAEQVEAYGQYQRIDDYVPIREEERRLVKETSKKRNSLLEACKSIFGF